MRRHVRALFAITALGSLFAFTGSASAAECPNEAIRIAQGATHLPDCRAYEQVSPADSTGGIVGIDNEAKLLFGAARADGNAMAFGSSAAVGGSERGSLVTSNLAHRSAAGWSSFGVLTTSEPTVRMDTGMAPTRPFPSADMTRMMFSPGRTLGAPDPTTSGGSVYLSAPEGKGPPTWLSRWTFEGTQPNPAPSMILPLGGAPDLSSGFFRYPTPLTNLAGDNLRTSKFGIYFFEGTRPAPAGVLPSGTVSPLGALPAGTHTQNSSGSGPDQAQPWLSRNQVSADGSKLFFVSPAEGAAPKQLYVQEGASPGRLISHDLLGDPAPAGVTGMEGAGGSQGYATATADGSRVIFRSESALTTDAPAEGLKTYRAEITPSAVTLTYLPAVTGYPMAIDNDASTIFFRIPGTSASLTSYYVWSEGNPVPRAVATDLNSGLAGSGRPHGPPMLEPVFSDDGEVLVFTSGAEVEPGVAPLPEINYDQIYRWTRQTGTAVCISCRRDGGIPGRFGSRVTSFNGQPTDNPAFPGGGMPNLATQSSVVGNRKISSDGSRVFFDTNDPLDPARDVNNARDVYMWENGAVHLLTSGRNPVPSYVLDNSEQGDDVMLLTKDGLVPSDTNQTYDVYDVRVNGGFAEPVSDGCEGDACQSQSSGPRQAAAPASAELAWAGSRKESRKGKARSRKALATTQLGRPGPNNARVRIQVPSAGRVSIAGADVRNKARQVRKRGSVVIAVGLSKPGKQKLARKGQLKTTVKVTFRPKSGAVIRKTTKLSFAGPKGGRR